MSASKQAAKRLQKEHQALEKAPPPFVYARPKYAQARLLLRGSNSLTPIRPLPSEAK